MSPSEFEQVERLSDPDPFDLARTLSRKIRGACSCEAATSVKFLWLYVAKDSIGCPEDSEESTVHRPTLEQWLNVIDEAATLGVERLVISAQSDLSHVPDIWEIARWSQDTHGMTVGIHIFTNTVSESMTAQMKTLNLERLRLFVSDASYNDIAALENVGIKVRVAKPASENPHHACTMPQAMLFVNPSGHLYTCGMVEGKKSFCLGNIFEGLFSLIVSDPALPHSVPPESQDVARGCEGCPPLLSRYLYED